MQYKASQQLLLVIVFYALWVAAGTISVKPPGHMAILAPLDSPDGGILHYAPGSLVAWKYTDDGFEVFDPGSWGAKTEGRPLAACTGGLGAAVAIAAPDKAALLITGGREYWYRASWISPRAYAACSSSIMAVGFSGEARSVIIVYRDGVAFEVRLPRLYGLEADEHGRVYAAVGEGLIVLEPKGAAEMLVYPGYKVTGVFDNGRLVGLEGDGRILVAPTTGGLGLSLDDGNGTTRVEAATLDHGTVQAYVRPPQGWGRVACTTPGGEAYSLEAAASLAFSFTTAGESNGTLWFSGVLFNGTRKEMMIAVVDGCEPAMVPWPRTVFYLKRAEPDPLNPTTAPAPEPETIPANVETSIIEAYKTRPASKAPSIETRVYHAYMDRLMIVFTLAAVAAGPAVAAYKAMIEQDMNPRHRDVEAGTSPR